MNRNIGAKWVKERLGMFEFMFNQFTFIWTAIILKVVIRTRDERNRTVMNVSSCWKLFAILIHKFIFRIPSKEFENLIRKCVTSFVKTRTQFLSNELVSRIFNWRTTLESRESYVCLWDRMKRIFINTLFTTRHAINIEFDDIEFDMIIWDKVFRNEPSEISERQP